MAHSGEVDRGEYSDRQGVMGISYGVDDQNICFNPAKNYQLGWYEDKVKTIDPLSSDAYDGDSHLGVRTFTMNGVSDYKKNDSGLIVLRLEQTSSEQDYYIGFNRKAGINADTGGDGDAVTIVRKEAGLPDEFGASTKVAALELGESYTIKKFNGKRRDIKIRYIAYLNGDATIEIIDSKNAKNVIEDKNGPCVKHKVEVMTDFFPGDIKWVVVEDGGIGRFHAKNPTYTEKFNLYKTEFCLPPNIRYKFIIEDEREDALCFEGKGFYRGFDSNDNIIFSGGCTGEFGFNGFEEKSFVAFENAADNAPSIIPSPVPSKILPSDPSMKPSKRKRRFRRKRPKLDSPSAFASINSQNGSSSEPSLPPSTDPLINLAMVARFPATRSPTRQFSYPQQDSHTLTRMKSQSEKRSKKAQWKVDRRRSRKRKQRRKRPQTVSNPPSLPPSTIPPSSLPPSKLPPFVESSIPTQIANPSNHTFESVVDTCVDSEHEFRYDRFKAMLSCNEVGEMKKCDATDLATREKLWSHCPKTCKRCTPSKQEIEINGDETEVLETWNGGCSDSNNEFRYDIVKKMLTCDQVGEMKKCDAIDIAFKKQLWFYCPKTCKRCEESNKIII